MTPRPTALITGASSGIGAAFAHRLAASGHDLILVARRVEKLNALAGELRAAHTVAVEVFPADLSRPEEVQRVADRLAACESLALLVNNAGFGKSGKFWQAEARGQLEMSQVHVMATVQLTRAALPGMVARRQGGVINVSSVASFLPRSSGTMYHATKAFLNAFSAGLELELQGTGVRVQALCPGFTVTGFHDSPEYPNFRRSKYPAFLWLSADQVAADSLADLKHGRLICVPGRQYQVLVALLTGCLTRPLMSWISRRFLRRSV